MSMVKDRRHDTVKNSFIWNGLIFVENTSDPQAGLGAFQYFFFRLYCKTKIDSVDMPANKLSYRN
jgi:hypothetical protein